MEKKSKLNTIVDAFTKESEISLKVLEERRKICGSCIYNSSNTKKNDLNIIEKARQHSFPNKPFCRACGCNIDEKTTQETEECGLVSLSLQPKWNRIRLETVSRHDLDIINRSENIVNVDLSSTKEYYSVSFGEVDSLNVKNIQLELNSKPNLEFVLEKVRPSCGVCTSANYKKLGEGSYLVNISMDMSKVGISEFNKNVFITYKIDGKLFKNIIKLTGKINK